MKILVDQNIRGAEDSFGRHGRIDRMDGREIDARHVNDADVLIIRTATRVDEQLLANSRVRFVGTTSIGTDHLDIAWLDKQGISWASAPGCNADAAAQYTLSIIWLACERLGRPLREQRVGLIGLGNVGSRVKRLLTTLEVSVVAHDPPLAARGHPDLVSLDEVLQQNIVSLHVPLEYSGPCPTFQLIGAKQLSRLPDHALLVNTARGDVVNGSCLLEELNAGRLQAGFDVWPGEPLFSAELLERTVVGTPHVAGYSVDGKIRGTRMVYNAFLDWLGEPGSEVPAPAPEARHSLELVRCDRETGISLALSAACFVSDHDEMMRRTIPACVANRAREFDRLRREYPARRDFRGWDVNCQEADLVEILNRLGFAARLKE